MGYFSAEKCPAGTYKGADDTDCVECGPNTVSLIEGATSCIPCSLGSQPNSEKTSCGKLSSVLTTLRHGHWTATLDGH